MTGTTPTKPTGFTLIEIMVAISIFSIVLLLIVTIVGHTTFVQNRQRGNQAVQEELRFALDVLNREARTAYGNTFNGTTDRINFRNQNGECVEYHWDRNKLVLERAEGTTVDPADDCNLQANYSGQYQSLTGSKVQVQNALFTIHPAAVDTATSKLSDQGFVVVSLKAASAVSPDTSINFQSAVTSRQTTPWAP